MVARRRLEEGLIYYTQTKQFSKKLSLEKLSQRRNSIRIKLHLRVGITRLCLLRKEELISVEDYAELSRVEIPSHPGNSEGNLLRVTRVTAG